MNLSEYDDLMNNDSQFVEKWQTSQQYESIKYVNEDHALMKYDFEVIYVR